MDDLLVYLFVAALAIFGGYYINNWYNKISKRVHLLESQVYLMLKIAEKHGVSEQDQETAKSIAAGKVQVHFGE